MPPTEIIWLVVGKVVVVGGPGGGETGFPHPRGQAVGYHGVEKHKVEADKTTKNERARAAGGGEGRGVLKKQNKHNQGTQQTVPYVSWWCSLANPNWYKCVAFSV